MEAGLGEGKEKAKVPGKMRGWGRRASALAPGATWARKSECGALAEISSWGGHFWWEEEPPPGCRVQGGIAEAHPTCQSGVCVGQLPSQLLAAHPAGCSSAPWPSSMPRA